MVLRGKTPFSFIRSTRAFRSAVQAIAAGVKARDIDLSDDLPWEC